MNLILEPRERIRAGARVVSNFARWYYNGVMNNPNVIGSNFGLLFSQSILSSLGQCNSLPTAKQLEISEQNELIIFPNPSLNGQFSIAIPANLIYSELEIYNSLGQLVHIDRIKNEVQEFYLTIPSGIYIIRIKDNGKVVTKTFINRN